MTSDSNPTSSESADVITQPGLYEDRMGNVCEVTVEESQSEGKQWVVRADGSPTYYTSDGRRVSYKGPGSEHDDPCQLMRYVGPPPATAPITGTALGPIPATDPITVKPGWWEMRDGHQIQVFEWQPDPPQPKNPFKWCGLTPSGDVIFWTDGGHCVFSVIAAEEEISDSDLVKFLDVPDSVRIRTLNETLQMKHQVIREMEHDLAQRQKTIETQAGVIQNLQIGVEAIAAKRLSDLQKSYNDMVVDRDEWRDRAAQYERMVSSNTMTIEMLQSQLLQVSKEKQSPAGHQAEIDRLSAKNESITRLALTKQEENDSLRQLNTELQVRLDAMTNAFESQSETSRQLRDRLEKCLSANAELISSVDAMATLREQVSHPNLSLIVAKLTKPDNQQQQQIIVSGLTILSQLVRKNMDYQGSAFTPPILMPKTSPIVAMCCRASDKIARLANLLSGTPKQVESETVLDTIGDLAGYSVLLYSYCNTIQGTAELEAIIEEFFATTTTTTATTTNTTTIDTTEERQV